MRRFLPLLLLLLPACQHQAAQPGASQNGASQNAALEARVQALEAEVKALKAAQSGGFTLNSARQVARDAAAQHCAVELARSLEQYRQDSLQGRYPQRAEVNVPDACMSQRVVWRQLTPHAYRFEVHDASGKALASQQSS